MRGYFEWTGEKGDKTPHFIHGDGILAAAGLTWSMEVQGEHVRCFVVVTREAWVGAVQIVHQVHEVQSAGLAGVE